MAACAHDAAAFILRGHSAILNFPDFLQFLPCPPSSSPADIKAAAAAAAAKINLILSRSAHQIKNRAEIMNIHIDHNATNESSSITCNINPVAECTEGGSISSEEFRSKQSVISPDVDIFDQSAALQKIENEDQFIMDSANWVMNIEYDLPAAQIDEQPFNSEEVEELSLWDFSV